MARVLTRMSPAPSPRRFAFIFGGVVLLIVVAAILITRLTAPAGADATAALRIVVEDGAKAAWQQATPRFRSVVPEARWAQYAAAYRLGSIRSITWNSRRVKDDHALVKGWIATSDGRHRVVMMLDQSDSRWRMAAISIDRDRLGPFADVYWPL